MSDCRFKAEPATGHGGFGYQSSYGCSQEVVKLVDDALGDKAKL